MCCRPRVLVDHRGCSGTGWFSHLLRWICLWTAYIGDDIFIPGFFLQFGEPRSLGGLVILLTFVRNGLCARSD